MDFDERMEWLLPNRIMKTVRGLKNPVGGRRLFIIGIGTNGVDVALRCKDFAENYCDFDQHSIRFLGIDLSKNLKSAEYNGSLLLSTERVEIDPETAVYPYLNDPKRLPEPVREWFDEGLFNYTQNEPVYGVKKRQCARLCVFHYLDKLIERFERARNDFSEGKIPLEIVVTGNLGDSFFGGMAIDLAYLIRSVFESVAYPVRICAHLLAADTAPLQGLTGRDLAIFYANTVVAKSELDSFQYKRRRFVQVYSSKMALQCDYPPFLICNVYAADETYDSTADKLAVNIMSRFSAPGTLDGDIEKKCSYNMFTPGAKQKFRYITGVSVVNVVPVAKMFCYLSLKIIVEFDNFLLKNTINEMDLGVLKGKVCPDALMLASKAGDIPRLEFDKMLNPLFSYESLRRGGNASKTYVTDRLEIIQGLCETASEAYSQELYDYVVNICEGAIYDIKKGPRYAEGIVKGCMNALRHRADAIRRTLGDIDENVAAEENGLKTYHRRLKAPGFIAKKAVEPYIDRLKSFAELKKSQLTGQIMVAFYDKLYSMLEKYVNDNLCKLTNLFNSANELVNSDKILKFPSQNEFIREVFDSSEEGVRKALDRAVTELSDDRKLVIFKRVNLRAFCQSDSKGVANEVIKMSEMCFGGIWQKSFEGFCSSFGAGENLADILSDCVQKLPITTPADDERSITRVVLPAECECSDLPETGGGEILINGSTMRNAVVITKIKGNVRIDKFKDYEQWENMRYAYVNDSLKRQGIHIFK